MESIFSFLINLFFETWIDVTEFVHSTNWFVIYYYCNLSNAHECINAHARLCTNFVELVGDIFLLLSEQNNFSNRNSYLFVSIVLVVTSLSLFTNEIQRKCLLFSSRVSLLFGLLRIRLSNQVTALYHFTNNNPSIWFGFFLFKRFPNCDNLKWNEKPMIREKCSIFLSLQLANKNRTFFSCFFVVFFYYLLVFYAALQFFVFWWKLFCFDYPWITMTMHVCMYLCANSTNWNIRFSRVCVYWWII